MSADALSQEEIDALLKGAGGGGGEPPAFGGGGSGGGEPPRLSPDQIKAVEQYGDRMATTLADMIGTFLAQSASANRRGITGETTSSLLSKIEGNVVVAHFNYEGAVQGHSALILPEKDATRIGGTMFGDPEAEEFTEMIADAVKEVFNTVLGNLTTSLSPLFGKGPVLGQLDVEAVTAAAEPFTAALGGEPKLALIPFNLKVGDLVDTTVWQAVSIDLVRSIESAIGSRTGEPAASGGGVQAAPVQFEALTEDRGMMAPPNLNLIFDIGLEVRVELGRTHMRIRDVLNLGNGSVVELDKLAGEPVDLLVNDVIFAKGEVVVIDENFGVRVTEILSLDDRIKTLGERKES